MTAVSSQPRRNELRPLRWRVLVAVPPSGFGDQHTLMRGWLDENCVPGGWSSAPAGTSGVVNDAIAFYFADPGAARAFVARFSCGYRAGPAGRL